MIGKSYAIQWSKIIADAIFLVHLSYIGIIVCGAVLSLWFPRIAPYQLALILLTVIIPQFIGGCPLTSLEIQYRKKYQPDIEFVENSFYAHYFFYKLLHIRVTNDTVKIFLTVTKVIPNILPVLVLLKIL